MGFARSFAHKVVFMDNGRIVEVAKPDDMFSNPTDARTKQFLSALVH
jgi:ABC-type polar amino acid transport system ATPase subunit